VSYQFVPYPKRKRRKNRDSSSKSLAREKAWQAFSLYVRMRDRTCLMGAMYGGCSGPLQAGHVIPKNRSRFLYWSEDNVFGQCSAHNSEHNRNASAYITWYIKTHGHEAWLDLERRSRIFRKDHTLVELRKLKSLYEHKTIELSTRNPATA
jgi:hypothetical protein